MKRIVKRTIAHQCGICKTRYPNKKEAMQCERMPVEKRKFRVGDIVNVHEERQCLTHQRYYRVRKAKVIGIFGPQSFDYEYTVKWLGGRGVGTHVYQYEVAFLRACCKDVHTHLYYAPEIQKA